MSNSSQNIKVRNIRKWREKSARQVHRPAKKPGKKLFRLPNHVTQEPGWETADGSPEKTSRMFVAMLALHFVAVAGLVAFHFLGKDVDKDAAKQTPPNVAAAKTPESASPAAATAAPVPPPTPAKPPGYTDYTIRTEDSWASIATANGISEEELRGANPGVEFHIGRALLIPPRRNIISPHAEAVAERKQTIHLPDAAQQGSPQVRYAANPEGRVSPPTNAEEARGEAPAPTAQQPRRNAPMGAPVRVNEQLPAKVTRQHKVAAGETLYSLSKKYGVTVNQIKRANGLTDDNLRRGQVLKLP